jgi:hypothetical protein
VTRPPKPTFRLTLVAQHRDGDANGMRRLRAVLKLLLRSFGFRCTWIEYPPASVPDDDYARPLPTEPRLIDGPPDVDCDRKTTEASERQ